MKFYHVVTIGDPRVSVEIPEERGKKNVDIREI